LCKQRVLVMYPNSSQMDLKHKIFVCALNTDIEHTLYTSSKTNGMLSTTRELLLEQSLLLLHNFFHHWALTSLPFNFGPLGFDTDGLRRGLLPFLVLQYCGARNLRSDATQVFSDPILLQESAKRIMGRRIQEKQ